MTLLAENFFKRQLLNSKISVFLATMFSVLIIGVLGLLAINYNGLKESLKESISFNLVLSEATQELETQRLVRSLSLIDGVKSVKYISKSESANKLIDNLGEDFLSILGENPLNNIIEITYHANYIETINTKDKIDKFRSYDHIDDVVYDEEIILLLEKNFKKLGVIFVTISVFFFIIAFILINSNIRLTIYSKRFIIKTMQLVGATKKFIQRPFLITNLIHALMACFSGSILLTIIFFIMMDKFPEIHSFMSLTQLIYILLISSIINLNISLISTWICVRKYLNLKTDELYK